ncbi:MAG: GldM family protein, partial [Bacteroidota bacterium]
INMMYLVLLALLAMNVSAEVLNAFENIREKLEVSANAAEAAGADFIKSMKTEIDEEVKNENKTTNVGLKDTLDQIRAKTNEVIGSINMHIEEMRKIGKYDTATGLIEKKDELDLNWKYWMGTGDGEAKNPIPDYSPQGEGEAMKLRDEIDGYYGYLVNLYNSQLKGDDAASQMKKLEEEKLKNHDGPSKEENKSWEKNTFEGPVVANLAVLEALKIDVYKKEKELLDLLNTRLGVATFKVDKVVSVNAPTATIVPAGLQFQTKLYVAMSSSAIKPTFTSGSGKIEKQEGGNSATLTIPARGNVIPKGKNEGVQKYTASIRVPKATGGFENLPVEGEFTVRKPEIVITSATVQNLYQNCGNEINIDVPALGDAYNPKVTASNATVRPSAKSKVKFMIVPTGKKCVVGVNTLTNGQNIPIGTVDYRVIKPPKPSVQLKVNGKVQNNPARPVTKASRLLVQIIPDAEFKAALPKDARYGVTSIDVLAQLSLGPPKRVNSASGSGRDGERGIPVSMGTEIRQARPGTKVYLRINDIYRKNFMNKQITDKRFSEVERTMFFTVK